MGSCEQLMIGTAVGLAENGYIPVCYSITPFVLFRPYEMIRNYLNHDNINVKLLGTGRDRDYDGFSHWAEDDIDSLKHFKNIKLYKPKELTQDVFNDFMFKCGPSYLNVSRA
jgi:transketolase